MKTAFRTLWYPDSILNAISSSLHIIDNTVIFDIRFFCSREQQKCGKPYERYTQGIGKIIPVNGNVY